MKIITSCEDPSTVYLEFPDIRLIVRDGEYVGWYKHAGVANEEA